jgi:hypothetical protein
MKVFTVFRPEQAKLLQVWARSWAANGWTTRLLLPRDGSPGRAAKGGKIVPPTLINYSLRPRHLWRHKKFGAKGWESADLVLFPPDSTDETVIAAGRPLPSDE